MFWQEDEDKSIPYQIPDDIVDLTFPITCKKLSIDHAWALSQAILAELPWIKDEKQFAIHHIHVAETGNGWLRPDDTENQFLWPSRRTKMHLRVAAARIQDAQQLCGKSLNIKGDIVKLGDTTKIKKLTNASVIFSRHVLSSEDEDENAFLTRMHNQIFDITGAKVRKLICGISNTICTANGRMPTRHLMVADLESESSIKIQQHCLGEGQLMGCGIFLPHKGIKSLHTTE